jgi:hypothetical protein
MSTDVLAATDAAARDFASAAGRMEYRGRAQAGGALAGSTSLTCAAPPKFPAAAGARAAMRYTFDFDDNNRGWSVAAVLRRFAALFLSILVTAGALPAGADTVVITADRRLDVLGGRVLEHPRITVTDGRITAIESAGSGAAGTGTSGASATSGTRPPPADTRHVDLPGLTLLPGLIDMHTHITSDPRYGGYRVLEFTDNF